MTVSRTILQQLGGHRFLVMTGAKNLVGADKYLTMRLPRGAAKDAITGVKIELTPLDTYDIEFYKFTRAHDLIVVSRATDIYADSLQEVFTRYTGLNTRL